jgi:hypothetical protein
MRQDLYQRLVDMYAGQELSEELEEILHEQAFKDASLGQDMLTMRKLVEVIRAVPAPEFTEESYQRILMNLYANGVAPREKENDAPYLQYSLPITS